MHEFRYRVLYSRPSVDDVSLLFIVVHVYIKPSYFKIEHALNYRMCTQNGRFTTYILRLPEKKKKKTNRQLLTTCEKQ